MIILIIVQVALLAPTKILANQHLQVISNRMPDVRYAEYTSFYRYIWFLVSMHTRQLSFALLIIMHLYVQCPGYINHSFVPAFSRDVLHQGCCCCPRVELLCGGGEAKLARKLKDNLKSGQCQVISRAYEYVIDRILVSIECADCAKARH